MMLKIAAKHPDPKALELLVREFTSAGTSMAPGFTGMGGNRPKVMPLVRLFSITVDKAIVDEKIFVEVDGQLATLPESPASSFSADHSIGIEPEPPTPIVKTAMTSVPLIKLAWGRSGDKGNHANIGIIARQPELLPYIRQAPQPHIVNELFEHYAPTEVRRFDLPGIHAVNFMLYDVLGGGGIASLRNDPQGKGYAQILLDVKVPVPAELVPS